VLAERLGLEVIGPLLALNALVLLVLYELGWVPRRRVS
jgi:hypothetical protein